MARFDNYSDWTATIVTKTAKMVCFIIAINTMIFPLEIDSFTLN